MIHRFKGLRHHSIIGGNHKNDDVSSLGSSRTHTGECRVTGGVNKGKRLSTPLNLISANVLSDTPSFSIYDIR